MKLVGFYAMSGCRLKADCTHDALRADSLLAILAPKAPPQYLQDLQEPTDGAGEFNDPARFRHAIVHVAA